MKRSLSTLLLALLLAGCTSEKGIVDKGAYELDTRHQAQAAYPRIKVLVIHYTADDFDTSLATLTDKNVISFWRGTNRINDTSVGIELENRGWQKSAGVKRFTPFEPAQIAALVPLAKDIIARYNIRPENVVAHSDIAPQRKDDPGPLFPWRQLAQQGIGAWPDPARVAFYINGRPRFQAVDTAALLDLLARYGYDVPANSTPAQQKRIIMVFQMHFRPDLWNGVADVETMAIAEALLGKVRTSP